MNTALAFAAIGLSLVAGQPPTAPAAHAPSPARVDACALLADADVQRTLGDTVKARTPSSMPAGGGLHVDACDFVTAGAHDVSLAVAAPTVGSSVSPRRYWRRQFHPPASPTGTSKPGPVAVAGIGDEAYWTGGAIGGSIYVLRGDAFIRLSVGGIKAETARLEKSRALALAAIARLPK